VLVGRIADIERDADGNAVVELRLNSDVELPADSSAEIRSKTVFGQKWVEIIPTATSGPILQSGSVIPDERTREPLELERALQLGHDLLSEIPLEDLADIFAALAEGFSGQEKDARTSIDRGLVALRAVNSRADELDLSLKQLRTFSEWLDENDVDLLSFLAALDDANRALLAAGDQFVSSNQSVPVFLDSLASFQEKTEADFGRLVEQGATVAEIVAKRADDLADIVVELRPFTTVWNSGLSQPCGGLFEDHLTCWQVYQASGLDSRGLYHTGQGPNEDEPGDPNYKGASRSTVSAAAFTELLSQYTDQPVPSDLAILLFSPARDALPALVGADG
jgi:virulence factor Mce-like protein